MKPLSLRTRRLLLLLSTAVFLAALPALALYTTGYRLGPNLRLVKTGGIYVAAPKTGATIFLDEQEVRTTNLFQSGFLLQNLTPGVYSLLVYHEDNWPWSKQVRVEEGLVTEARAFLVPKNLPLEVIEKSALEYKTAMALLAPYMKTATTSLVRLANHDREQLTLDARRTTLYVEWLGEGVDLPYYFCAEEGCAATTTVLRTPNAIRNADFYPKRRDVVVVALSRGIYAIEVDRRGGQLLQPIYKGERPYFVSAGDDASLYILDAGVLARLRLE